MIEAVVVALLGAAAVFRIVFSATRERTIWRTTFTICIAGAAVAAALTYYGDRMDQVFETWNLSKLLLHLVPVERSGHAEPGRDQGGRQQHGNEGAVEQSHAQVLRDARKVGQWPLMDRRR